MKKQQVKDVYLFEIVEFKFQRKVNESQSILIFSSQQKSKLCYFLKKQQKRSSNKQVKHTSRQI